MSSGRQCFVQLGNGYRLRNSPNRAEMMRWGLIPSFAKIPKLMSINLRDDSFKVKPYFRKLLSSKRVIVPASYYIEWRVEEGKKTPYIFKSNLGDTLSMAGVYDVWTGLGQTIKSFAIITTSPNKEAGRIHPRMPVLLDELEENTWLDPESKIDALLPLLDSYPDSTLSVARVSTLINNPRNNGPEVIQAS